VLPDPPGDVDRYARIKAMIKGSNHVKMPVGQGAPAREREREEPLWR
jgi:hypothetical protein